MQNQFSHLNCAVMVLSTYLTCCHVYILVYTNLVTLVFQAIWLVHYLVLLNITHFLGSGCPCKTEAKWGWRINSHFASVSESESNKICKNNFRAFQILLCKLFQLRIAQCLQFGHFQCSPISFCRLVLTTKWLSHQYQGNVIKKTKQRVLQ